MRSAGAVPAGAGPAEAREAQALRDFSLMVGAVAIARACDPVTARPVREAAKAGRGADR